MRYWYVTIASPLGPGAKFVESKAHLLDPEEYDSFVASCVSSLTLLSGQLLPPNCVYITWFTELPEEVARKRWPQKFDTSGLLVSA